MLWQTTYLIDSEIHIEKGEYISEGNEILIFEVAESPNENFRNTKRILRATCEAEPLANIADIHIYLESVVKVFLSKIAVVGYCKASILRHFSTTSKVGVCGISFDILITDVLIEKTYQGSVKPKDVSYSLEDLNDTSRFYFQNVSAALQTDSLEEKLLLLFTAIERYAKELSEEDVMNTCPSCKHVWSSGRKATNKKIKSLLKGLGIEDEMIKKFIEYRQLIAHGSKVKTAEYFSQIKDILLSTQHVFYEINSTLLGANFVNTEAPIIDNPYAIYEMNCSQEGRITVSPKSFTGKVGISRIFDSGDSSKRILKFSCGLYIGDSITSILCDPNDSDKIHQLYLPHYFDAQQESLE